MSKPKRKSYVKALIAKFDKYIYDYTESKLTVINVNKNKMYKINSSASGISFKSVLRKSNPNMNSTDSVMFYKSYIAQRNSYVLQIKNYFESFKSDTNLGPHKNRQETHKPKMTKKFVNETQSTNKSERDLMSNNNHMNTKHELINEQHNLGSGCDGRSLSYYNKILSNGDNIVNDCLEMKSVSELDTNNIKHDELCCSSLNSVNSLPCVFYLKSINNVIFESTQDIPITPYIFIEPEIETTSSKYDFSAIIINVQKIRKYSPICKKLNDNIIKEVCITEHDFETKLLSSSTIPSTDITDKDFKTELPSPITKPLTNTLTDNINTNVQLDENNENCTMCLLNYINKITRINDQKHIKEVILSKEEGCSNNYCLTSTIKDDISSNALMSNSGKKTCFKKEDDIKILHTYPNQDIPIVLQGKTSDSRCTITFSIKPGTCCDSENDDNSMGFTIDESGCFTFLRHILFLFESDLIHSLFASVNDNDYQPISPYEVPQIFDDPQLNISNQHTCQQSCKISKRIKHKSHSISFKSEVKKSDYSISTSSSELYATKNSLTNSLHSLDSYDKTSNLISKHVDQIHNVDRDSQLSGTLSFDTDPLDASSLTTFQVAASILDSECSTLSSKSLPALKRKQYY